ADGLLARRALAADVSVVARPYPRIDHAHLALAGQLHALGDGARELRRVGDRADTLRTLRHRQQGQIDVRLVDPLADPLVLNRPAAHAGHALLVRLVVVERPVVAHDEETRQTVVRRCPQGGEPHQVVAVADEPDDDATRVLERQRGAHGDARPGADAPASVAADVVEWVREVAAVARPAERQPGEANIDAGGRLVQRRRDGAERQHVTGAANGLVGGRGRWRVAPNPARLEEP